MEEAEQIEYELVDNQNELEKVARELGAQDEIAGDLEADSMFHYKERVCLLQLSTRDSTWLVDPFAVDSMSPIAPVFADAGIRKIFHGADYDVRCLYRDYAMEINNLFDTQLAARYLGLQETGLANLLENFFGLHLEKKYQKKNWAQRPLPEKMLSYAAHDTLYLFELSDKLRGMLKEKGRLYWVEEECELLSNNRPALKDDNPLFMRFKGAGRLDPRSLAVLEMLLGFREDMARRMDRPPFKVMGNTPILEMASRKPDSLRALKKVNGLSPKQVGRFGRQLLDRINTALDIPESELPRYPHKKRKSSGPLVAKRVGALKEWRQEKAAELEIDPAAVMTNTQIRNLAAAKPPPETPQELENVREIRHWQAVEFGEELIPLLSAC
ncbi:MAG: ribonuclease D [Desulfatibacillaceae bacterium]